MISTKSVLRDQSDAESNSLNLPSSASASTISPSTKTLDLVPIQEMKSNQNRSKNEFDSNLDANDLFKSLMERGLQNNLERLLNEKEWADIIFTFVGVDKKLKAHKIILAVDSSVFAKKCFGKGNQINLIMELIQDTSYEDFSVFIESFYKSKIAITDANIKSLLSCAIKYKARNCIQLCQNYIQHSLNVEHVLQVYESTLIYDYNNLADQCKMIILKNLDTILQSEEFKKCSTKAIINILNLNSPRDESKVIDALIERAKYSKGVKNLKGIELRKELEPFLKHIEFSDKNEDKFLTYYRKHKLVDIDELIESIDSIDAEKQKNTEKS